MSNTANSHVAWDCLAMQGVVQNCVSASFDNSIYDKELQSELIIILGRNIKEIN
jgi:hypothetical protein